MVCTLLQYKQSFTFKLEKVILQLWSYHTQKLLQENIHCYVVMVWETVITLTQKHGGQTRRFLLRIRITVMAPPVPKMRYSLAVTWLVFWWNNIVFQMSSKFDYKIKTVDSARSGSNCILESSLLNVSSNVLANSFLPHVSVKLVLLFCFTTNYYI